MITREELPSFTWIQPCVNAEVHYREWTRMRVLRLAEFVTIVGELNHR
jgi:hypothetical protein